MQRETDRGARGPGCCSWPPPEKLESRTDCIRGGVCARNPPLSEDFAEFLSSDLPLLARRFSSYVLCPKAGSIDDGAICSGVQLFSSTPGN